MMGSLSRGEQLLLDGVRQKSRLYDFNGVGAVGFAVKTSVKKHVRIEWLFDFRTHVCAIFSLPISTQRTLHC